MFTLFVTRNATLDMPTLLPGGDLLLLSGAISGGAIYELLTSRQPHRSGTTFVGFVGGACIILAIFTNGLSVFIAAAGPDHLDMSIVSLGSMCFFAVAIVFAGISIALSA
jgi:hypothetical protein